MADYLLTIKRVQPGFTQSAGAVPANASTVAEVHSAITRNPDNISVVVQKATEAQIRGLVKYGVVITRGGDSSAVETEVDAAMP